MRIDDGIVDGDEIEFSLIKCSQDSPDSRLIDSRIGWRLDLTSSWPFNQSEMKKWVSCFKIWPISPPMRELLWLDYTNYVNLARFNLKYESEMCSNLKFCSQNFNKLYIHIYLSRFYRILSIVKFHNNFTGLDCMKYTERASFIFITLNTRIINVYYLIISVSHKLISLLYNVQL